MGIMYCEKCDKHIDLDTDLEEWEEETEICWTCHQKGNGMNNKKRPDAIYCMAAVLVFLWCVFSFILAAWAIHHG